MHRLCRRERNRRGASRSRRRSKVSQVEQTARSVLRTCSMRPAGEQAELSSNSARPALEGRRIQDPRVSATRGMRSSNSVTLARRRYLPVRSRCAHPGQQQGRRWPSSSSSWVRRMRRSRVTSCLASSTQQMNSLRARGVMSFQASSAVALPMRASRRSAGSLCTTPPGTRWLPMSATVASTLAPLASTLAPLASTLAAPVTTLPPDIVEHGRANRRNPGTPTFMLVSVVLCTSW